MIEHVVAEQSLEDLEAVIERGLATFVEVGAALLTIREQRLYSRDHGYSSFETYCQERWGWKRARADQLIRASEIATQLDTNVSAPPKNEAQARELARIPDPVQRAEVWTAVREERGERVTAADIRRAVAEPELDANGMLPVIDLDTGEVVRPARFHVKTDEDRVLDRRREVTRTFVETFSLLSSLLLEDRDQIADMWEPSANTMADVEPLAYLWSSQGIRSVARRLDRLADKVDEQGGRLG